MTRKALVACLALSGLVLVFLLGCGGGGSSSATPSPTLINLTTFQPASVVLGQPSFTTNMANQGGGTMANTLQFPFSPGTGSLYVADQANHRVLGFNSVPGASNAAGDFALGQTTLTGGSPAAASATTLRGPMDALTVGGKLVVADAGNHRVLIWNSLPTTNAAAANVAVGQPNLTSSSMGGGSSGLRDPWGLAAGGGRLLVADASNNRVLIWNTLPTTSGTAADLVLGQADFTGTLADRGGPTSAGSLDGPSAVWTDGTRVVVVDRNNMRVLIWTAFPTTNGQAADVVLGQSTFTFTAQAAGAMGLRSPTDVSSNGTQLFVADGGNNRVLWWNTFPTVNTQPADGVIGQFDFTGGTANDDDHDGAQDATPSSRTLWDVGVFLGVHVSGNQLFVGDGGNNRLLIFNGT